MLLATCPDAALDQLEVAVFGRWMNLIYPAIGYIKAFPVS